MHCSIQTPDDLKWYAAQVVMTTVSIWGCFAYMVRLSVLWMRLLKASCLSRFCCAEHDI